MKAVTVHSGGSAEHFIQPFKDAPEVQWFCKQKHPGKKLRCHCQQGMCEFDKTKQRIKDARDRSKKMRDAAASDSRDH